MDKITFQHRLKSMIIDFCIICVTSIPFILLIFILKLENVLVFQVFVISLLSSLLICKDLLKEKSIGKRVMNLRIICGDKILVSPLKLILRNIFTFIWPIEIVMCMINPERKLGDIVFRTKVVLDDKKVNFIHLSNGRIFIYFFIILILVFILFYLLSLLFIRSNGLLRLLFT